MIYDQLDQSDPIKQGDIFRHGIAKWFYLAYDEYAFAGREVFGLSVGSLYLGYYGHWLDNSIPAGWCLGFVDENGSLIEKG
jgi:hypothetical protein